MSSINRWVVLLVGAICARLAWQSWQAGSVRYTLFSGFVGLFAVWAWFQMAKMDGVFPLGGETA